MVRKILQIRNGYLNNKGNAKKIYDLIVISDRLLQD